MSRSSNPSNLDIGLDSAFDFNKFVGVFSNFVTVIREQQTKIDSLEKKLSEVPTLIEDSIKSKDGNNKPPLQSVAPGSAKPKKKVKTTGKNSATEPGDGVDDEDEDDTTLVKRIKELEEKFANFQHEIEGSQELQHQKEKLLNQEMPSPYSDFMNHLVTSKYEESGGRDNAASDLKFMAALKSQSNTTTPKTSRPATSHQLSGETPPTPLVQEEQEQEEVKEEVPPVIEEEQSNKEEEKPAEIMVIDEEKKEEDEVVQEEQAVAVKVEEQSLPDPVEAASDEEERVILPEVAEDNMAEEKNSDEVIIEEPAAPIMSAEEIVSRAKTPLAEEVPPPPAEQEIISDIIVQQAVQEEQQQSQPALEEIAVDLQKEEQAEPAAVMVPASPLVPPSSPPVFGAAHPFLPPKPTTTAPASKPATPPTMTITPAPIAQDIVKSIEKAITTASLPSNTKPFQSATTENDDDEPSALDLALKRAMAASPAHRHASAPGMGMSAGAASILAGNDKRLSLSIEDERTLAKEDSLLLEEDTASLLLPDVVDLPDVPPKKGARAKMRMSVVLQTKRAMNRANIPWLKGKRLRKILQELRIRGHFIALSKKSMQDERMKFANSSLKNKVDLLEADVKKMTKNLEQMKLTLKKNNMALREGLPGDLRGLLQEVEFLLQAIDSFGGMNHFMKLLHIFQKIDWRKFLPEGKSILYNDIGEYLSTTILKDMNDLNVKRYQKQELKFAEMVSQKDLASMLKLSTNSLDLNTDENHIKLLKVIESSTKASFGVIDKLREENQRKMLQSMEEAHSETEKLFEEYGMNNRAYTNARVEQIVQDLHRTNEQELHRSYEMEEELMTIQSKMKRMEDDKANQDAEYEKTMKDRRQEQEQLRILQKRLQSISLDKLMDELKSMRNDLRERPSKEQIDEMMTNIEGTFKRHMGDNVGGLTNLVSQVYKYLQTKVDREDIRNLIAARLVQMEKELSYREQEMFELASSSRCLSCGQLPAHLRPRTTLAAFNELTKEQNSKSRQQAHGIAEGEEGDEQQQQHHMMAADDEAASVSTFGSASVLIHPDGSNSNRIIANNAYNPANPQHTAVPYSNTHNEQIYQIITGQARLKPLQLQHEPMQPHPDPYHLKTSSSTSQLPPPRAQTAAAVGMAGGNASLSPAKRRLKPVEPLYRRARQVNQTKDMVKVIPASTMEYYGYHANNPLYVMDGNVQDVFLTGGGGGGGNGGGGNGGGGGDDISVNTIESTNSMMILGNSSPAVTAPSPATAGGMKTMKGAMAMDPLQKAGSNSSLDTASNANNGQQVNRVHYPQGLVDDHSEAGNSSKSTARVHVNTANGSNGGGSGGSLLPAIHSPNPRDKYK